MRSDTRNSQITLQILRLWLARSRRNLQLPGVKQQKTGEASFFPATVIADDDNSMLAIDDGRADAFSALEAWQAWNGDTACRRIWMTVPEPEIEMNLLACDRPTDDQISPEGGNVGHATNPLAAKVQQIKRGRYTGWLVCFED